MVRLHFCEVQAAISEINQRKFNIFLGNETAESGADIVQWTNLWTNFHNGVPVHKDYAVLVSGEGPQQALWLGLHPDLSSQPEYDDAILNGVEIFKLSNINCSLAGHNPIPGPQNVVDLSKALPSTHAGNSNKQKVIIGGAVGGGLLALAIGFCVFAASRHGKDHSPSDGSSGRLPKTNTRQSYASSLPSNLCRHFSFAEIEAATKNFDEALLLGVGGFGKVYSGEIDDGNTKVAIKRRNLLSGQGVHEFQTEIEMLSKLRHHHLVSLIGYCEENCEMILVYDYMAHGTLRGHLYNTEKTTSSMEAEA
ncbi:hypothetical protein LWI29_004067 [Acer saccharum]|uniref:Protein kinase domain-containing protein n=1 Tax=Acer saccharum TaxID=4024 RepID=A0AA39VFI2_ACESA|nr:hypothetical protein LWI29_004067 [Acer saccharum]